VENQKAIKVSTRIELNLMVSKFGAKSVESLPIGNST
jgi:hypothetical protein